MTIITLNRRTIIPLPHGVPRPLAVGRLLPTDDGGETRALRENRSGIVVFVFILFLFLVEMKCFGSKHNIRI